ncbi:MAG: TRAP transporter small permease [Beijerinckiaceae bacterium]
MSGAPIESRADEEIVGDGLTARLARALNAVNWALMFAASIAIVAASVVLSESVVVRYVFHAPTYWQDEAATFLLVGATFLTAAFVQERRGHVGIEALAEILPAGVNRVRRLFVDVASLAFVAFFSWKSWTLLHEAWVDGQVTSSTWGPPLWIPYSLMASGMTLLALQIALQLARGLTEKRA